MAVQVCEEKPRVASVTVETICEGVKTATSRKVQPKVSYTTGEDNSGTRMMWRNIQERFKEEYKLGYTDQYLTEELKGLIESMY